MPCILQAYLPLKKQTTKTKQTNSHWHVNKTAKVITVGLLIIVLACTSEKTTTSCFVKPALCDVTERTVTSPITFIGL